MRDENCLFCRIVAGEEPATRIWENTEFVAIKNKYPAAPVHLLVMPRDHVSKKGLVGVTNGHFWDKMMEAVFGVLIQEGLDQKGYKLVNNGAGYNHFDHEHIHVLGGTKEEPVGKT